MHNKIFCKTCRITLYLRAKRDPSIHLSEQAVGVIIVTSDNTKAVWP